MTSDSLLRGTSANRSVPVIEVRGVHKRFGHIDALRGVSLQVNAGEVIAIIGASGGGKSTLLRCVNHLTPPDRGAVLFHGKSIGMWTDESGRTHRQPKSELHRVRSKMPMVFQVFNLFKNRTALGNVVEGQVAVLKREKKEARARGLDALNKVGLADRAEAYPSQLSGGQQQRVGIARALAMDPEVILFDEPTSSLDPELVGEVLDTIQLLASEGMTMMVVTHEMAFARRSADMVYFLAEGKVCESGPPEEVFDNPNHERTKKFVDAILR